MILEYVDGASAKFAAKHRQQSAVYALSNSVGPQHTLG